jgi:hypothetical protein
VSAGNGWQQEQERAVTCREPPEHVEPQEPDDIIAGLEGQLEALRLERDHALARAAEAEALHLAWTLAGLPPGTLVERFNVFMARVQARQEEG